MKIRNDKYDLNRLAAELEKHKTIGQDGHASYNAFMFEELATVLQTCIEFCEELPEPERHRIITDAIVAAGAAGPVSRKSLLDEISRLESAFTRSSPRPFILATSLSVKCDSAPKRIMLDGHSIAFSRELPRSFDRSPLGDLLQSKPAQPRDFTTCRVRVTARSGDEAVVVALDALDYLRGAWNFSLNRRTLSQISMGSPKPVNQIRLGPVHTIHNTNGSLYYEHNLWYQLFFSTDEQACDLRVKWNTLRAEEKKIRQAIKCTPYSRDIKTAFIRYARALDSTDFELCHLRLWSLLEYLTDTTAGARFEQTISRCLFLYKDRELHRLFLEHLRDQRNAWVHAAAGIDQEELSTFQLKRYVEDMLTFHLQHRGLFRTKHDLGEYLDTPQSPVILRQRIVQFRRALRFRLR